MKFLIWSGLIPTQKKKKKKGRAKSTAKFTLAMMGKLFAKGKGEYKRRRKQEKKKSKKSLISSMAGKELIKCLFQQRNRESTK